MRAGVAQLWRYPVKSMAGERLPALFAGFSGIYGDRMYAFTREDGPAVFPYQTARQKAEMVLYRPRLSSGRAFPGNAEAILALPGAGPTPIFADDATVEVTTPAGAVHPIDDAALAAELGGGEALTLLRSDRTMADCAPVSLISLQTLRRLAEETGKSMDTRRFRMNLVADLPQCDGFAEDALVGRTIRIGDRVRLTVLERDKRCAMIGIDPDTAARDREIPLHVTSAHESCVGVYAAVLTEGIVREGDVVVVE